MQYTTSTLFVSILGVLPARIHVLAVLCFLVLAILGCPLQVGAGWVVWPPAVYMAPAPQRRFGHGARSWAWHWYAAWCYIRWSWRVPLWRSLAWAVLWQASGRSGPVWLLLSPWAVWAWQGVGILWPGLTRQPEWWILAFRSARLSCYNRIMRIYRVGQITSYVKSLFEMDDLLQDVWLEGEISNWRAYPSGHLYFTLKDDEAAINCVIWRSRAAGLGFAPRDGDGVLAHGYISIYEARGAYQLYVDDLRKAGAGLWALEFERLKNKLEAEGLFDPARKRPLPHFPRRLGVVTSPAGAAWHDICRVLARRYPLVEVLLSPTSVQGEEAPPQIVVALQRLAAYGEVDAIIVARGGGSAEDLWAFNDERVARAIAASPMPVISGVGHEVDVTIADLAADVRAPTPSAAAEIAVPDMTELGEALAQSLAGLEAGIHTMLGRAHLEMEHERTALRRASPRNAVNLKRQRLDELTRDLQAALKHELALRRAYLEGAEGRLVPLSPLGTLERGYALVLQRDGHTLVRSVRQAPAGQPLWIRVADGEFPARAEEGPRGPHLT